MTCSLQLDASEALYLYRFLGYVHFHAVLEFHSCFISAENGKMCFELVIQSTALTVQKRPHMHLYLIPNT